MEKINLTEKFAQITEHWRPKVVAELNNQEVKLVKFKGTFPWHHHEHEEEMFLCMRGAFYIELRDETISLQAGDFLIIPRGVEHRPIADEEVEVMLFEPALTRNTGNIEDEEFTAPIGARI